MSRDSPASGIQPIGGGFEMKRPSTIALTALMTLASASSLCAQDAGNRLSIPAIVTDNMGRFVTRLEPDQFVASVNGVEYAVSGLVPVDEPLQLAVIPLQTNSRSIAALMDVNRGLGSRLSPFPLVVDGGGTVIDGLQQAFATLRSQAGQRKAVLILGDTDEAFTPEEIRALVAGEGFPVFILSSEPVTGAVAQGGNSISGSALFDEIARQTGGLHLPIDTAERAAIGLANYYVLLLNLVGENAGYSDLDVALAPPPGLPAPFLVRHRVGYQRGPE